MAEVKYENVSVLVFDPDLTSRKGTAYALNNLGIRNIEEQYAVRELREIIANNDFDLMFLECGEELTEAFPIVTEIRQNQLGNNPFVSILLTLWQPTENMVKLALRSGADDILVKPFSANTVNERVALQISRRKPFVFQNDYRGPVRHSNHEELARLAPIEVPNHLRAKARSEPAPPISSDLVHSIVGFQRCREQQMRLREAVSGLRRYFDNPDMGDFPIGHATNLNAACDNLKQRAQDGGFPQLIELCEAASGTGAKINAAGAGSDLKDIAILEETVHAIERALSDRESAVKAAKEIADTVKNAG